VAYFIVHLYQVAQTLVSDSVETGTEYIPKMSDGFPLVGLKIYKL